MISEIKTQYARTNPQKPYVNKCYGMWWAQVHDANNKPVFVPCYSHQEALAEAYKLAKVAA